MSTQPDDSTDVQGCDFESDPSAAEAIEYGGLPLSLEPGESE